MHEEIENLAAGILDYSFVLLFIVAIGIIVGCVYYFI